MSYKIKLDPLARLDIEDNIDWYNQQQPKLGNRFYKHVKETLKLIKQNPFSFPVKYKNTRSVPVKKFPFTIHYLVDNENKNVAILSVFKTVQNPTKWEKGT